MEQVHGSQCHRYDDNQHRPIRQIPFLFGHVPCTSSDILRCFGRKGTRAALGLYPKMQWGRSLTAGILESKAGSQLRRSTELNRHATYSGDDAAHSVCATARSRLKSVKIDFVGEN